MAYLKNAIIILLFVLLAGCTDNANPQANDQEPKTNLDEKQPVEKRTEEEKDDSKDVESKEVEDQQENIKVGPPLPTSLEELADLPAGYTGYLHILKEEDQKTLDKLTANLPDISGNPTTEELDRYYEAILSVFQQDYVGPGDLINKLKFQAIGSPDMQDSRYQFKESLNVMVILDASGSMANIEENQTRMEAAKSAINNFVKSLPKEANVGLRIYGHEGSGSKADKARSCSSSELVYPIGQYDTVKFDKALGKAKPAGWTPIGLALNEAQKDLATFQGEANTNIVYLVSDGISTCDDDPVGSAKALYESKITPIINVIGFNVDQEGQKQLQEVAKVTEGTYQNVQDAKGLEDQLRQAAEVAKQWEKWKKSQQDSMEYQQVRNHLDIFGYHADEFRKWVDEGQQVGFTIQYLYQHKDMMSRESHDYLRQKNGEYHDWIEEEYLKLKRELEALNETNFNEAIKALEEKYLQNTGQ